MEPAWQAIKSAPYLGGWPRILFDDVALYSHLESDWSQILLRFPMLPDEQFYFHDPEHAHLKDFSFDIFLPEDESHLPLYNAALQEKSMVFLLDEEALREGLIKVLWIDIRGNV